MDPLAFHRDALSVAQRVIDDIDRPQFALPTPCDEQQPPANASSADRFAAFAGRRV